jgi:hypothetical protein
MISRDLWGKIIQDYLDLKIELIERDIKYEMPAVQRALVITGPRRAGKTYFMFQIINKLKENVEKERTIYLNFEDFRLTNIELKDMNNFLNVYYSIFPENADKTCYFFLDEVQNLPGWEKFVRFLLDKNNKVIVSGSSSKLLSKEIATELRGRSVQIRIFPFSFKEILKSKGITLKDFYSTKEEAKLRKFAREYLLWGSYPETILNPSLKEAMLKEILDLTVFRDVVERWKATNLKALRLLLLMLAKSTHLTISKAYRNLKSLTDVGKATVANYLEYLEDSHVFYYLKPVVKSYKKQELLGFKPYLVDNGLLTILGVEDKSRLLENLVFTELLKKNYHNLFYYTTGKEEVDFVIKSRQRTWLIQVTYELNEDNYKRELNSLIKASEYFDSKDLLILTWDQEELHTIDGKEVKVIPMWKWLLN